MPEPIKIRIDTTYNAQGAKEAQRDVDELEKKQSKPAVTTATDKQAVKEKSNAERQAAKEREAEHRRFVQDYQRDWKRAIEEEKRQKTEATRATETRSKQTEESGLYEKELQAREQRVRGQKKEADELDRHVFLQRRSVDLQRQYGYDKEKAMKMAEREAAVMEAGGHGHGGQFATARMLGEIGDMLGGNGMVMKAMQIQRGSMLLREAGLSRAATLGIGGAAAAVGAGLLFAHEYFSSKDDERAMQDRLREARTGDDRRLYRVRNYGSAEEAFGMYLSSQDQLAGLNAQRETLLHEARSGMMGRLFHAAGSKFFEEGWGWWKPESARKLEENQGQTEEAERMSEKSKDAAAKWFARIGARGITASELRTHGLTSEAQGVDIDLAVEAEKQRLKKSNASDTEIQRGMAAKRKELEEGGYASFMKQGGEAAIRVQELMNQGKISEAQAVETAVVWWQKYDEVLGKVGPKHADVAKRSADAAASAHEEGGFQRFRQEGGMDAIHAQELMNMGKIKEARVLQDNVAWWGKYNEVLAQVGPKHAEVAKEAADAEVFSRQRERAGNFAGALDARAGVSETLRVATLAAHAMGRDVDDGTAKAVDRFHQSSVNMYRESSEATWRAKFPSSWRERIKTGS